MVHEILSGCEAALVGLLMSAACLRGAHANVAGVLPMAVLFFASAVERAEAFPFVEKAMVGFGTNTVAAQERAYGYVLWKSRTMTGSNARWRCGQNR